VASSGQKNGRKVAQPREIGRALFWATLELLLAVVAAAHGGVDVRVLREAVGHSGWLQNGRKVAGEAARNFLATGEKIALGGRERGFGVIFGSFPDSIYTRNELRFILNIAGFQLT